MDETSRRRFLRGGGLALAVALAGCAEGGGGAQTSPEGETPTDAGTTTPDDGAGAGTQAQGTPTTDGRPKTSTATGGTESPTERPPTETPGPMDPAQNGVAWRYDLGAEIRSAPTVADGVVYVGGWHETGGTPTADAEFGPGDSLFALDAASGERRWQYVAEAPIQRRPRVVGDRVYAVRGRTALHGHGFQVRGLSTDGEELWVHETPSLKFLTVLGVDESGIYVGTHDDNLGGGNERVSAVGPDGAVRWQHDYVDVNDGALGPDAVFVGTYTGELGAYDRASGDERWRLEAGSLQPAIEGVVGDVVVVRDESFRGLDRASGEEVWAEPFENWYGFVADGRALVVQGDGSLAALEPTNGSVLWTDGFGSDYPAVAAADGTVYVVDDDGTLAALDGATGDKLWDRTVGAGAAAVPAGDRVYAHWREEGRAVVLDTETGARRTSFSFDGGGSTVVHGETVDVVTTRSGAVYGLER